MEHKAQVFLDQKCPRCGRLCGNGGSGFMVRCSCGWTGGLAPEDEAAVMEIWKRAKARDEAVETDDVGKPVRLCDKRCVANWDGHCAVEKCEGQIAVFDAKPVRDEASAVERYRMLKKASDSLWAEGGEKHGT